MFLDKYIEEKGPSTDFPIFKGEDHVDLSMNASDLFMAQFRGDSYNAVDVIVKYLAIENYYGLNDFGFSLYNKMQLLRTEKDWNDRFLGLIKSVEKGYDGNNKIETDLNYSIHDGAHRLSLALFHGIENIDFRLFNTNLYRRTYNIEWFIDNGFNKVELQIIREKFLELKSKFNIPYYCILWPPARNIYLQVENELRNCSNEADIVSSEEIVISKDDFKKFIYEIYATDDIKIEKLNTKYEKIIKSLITDNYNEQVYKIRLIKFIINNPNYRVKPITGLPQSKRTMDIKVDIRDKYKKYVTDYYYDIIMHMTDNVYQSKEVEKILNRIKRG